MRKNTRRRRVRDAQIRHTRNRAQSGLWMGASLHPVFLVVGYGLPVLNASFQKYDDMFFTTDDAEIPEKSKARVD